MSTLIDGAREATAAAYIRENIGGRLFPRYLGAILDFILLGVIIVQFISYARFFRTDKRHIVAIVTGSMICAVAASICILLWTTDIFVRHFGAYLVIRETYYWVRYGAIDMITIFLTQIFYIDRCTRLFRAWWPAAFLGTLSVCAVGFGIAAFFYAGLNYKYLDVEWVIILVYGWIGMIAVSDLAITITVVLGLRRVRTGWSHTDSVIRRVIVRSCEIQLPGLLVAVLTMGLFAQPDETATFFMLIHTKVYVCGLLTDLNSRIASPDESRPYSTSRISNTAYNHGSGESRVGRNAEIPGDIHMLDLGEPDDKDAERDTGGTGNRVKWEEDVRGKSEFGSTTGLTTGHVL